MNLAAYIRSFPRHKRMALRKHIAQLLGVSEVYVRSMCNGCKNIPGKYALAIEQITDGAVQRHVTSPTLYPPELTNPTVISKLTK